MKAFPAPEAIKSLSNFCFPIFLSGTFTIYPDKKWVTFHGVGKENFRFMVLQEALLFIAG